MGKYSFSIIVAMDETNTIGTKDNQIPWHIPEDLKYFKGRTKNSVVIMGRKTYESIVAVLGTALPGRMNVVISRTPSSVDILTGVTAVKSLEAALEVANTIKESETFIIGGGSIYAQAMDLEPKKIYVTEVKRRGTNVTLPGAVTFPEIDEDKYHVTDAFKYDGNETYELTFKTYEPNDGDSQTSVSED